MFNYFEIKICITKSAKLFVYFIVVLFAFEIFIIIIINLLIYFTPCKYKIKLALK